jgi:TRAP-type C4-dicarboxylate transport system substrate-binding protein
MRREELTMKAVAIALGGLVAIGAARADEDTTLRLATVAPDGTAWAREARAYLRDVAAATNGHVRVKWYFGGIAGDDVQIGERINRGQLDGAASGGMLCNKLAPSMRVLAVPGLFHDRGEVARTTRELHSTFDAEFRQSGYSVWGTFILGPVMFFTRTPVRSFADLRRVTFYNWDLNEVERSVLSGVGMKITPLSLIDAGPAYLMHRIDGFVTLPAAALAFQWSALSRYLLDLRVAHLTGCLVISDHALEHLSVADRQALGATTAKFLARLDVVGQQQDEALVGGLFKQQGIQRIPDDAVRSEFFEAAAAAIERVPESLLPHELLARVQAMLTQDRAHAH